MHEDVGVSAGAALRFAEEANARAFEALDGGVEIGNFHRHVVQAGSALREKLRDGGGFVDGFEEFDACVTCRQHGNVHLLVRDSFARKDGQGEVR